MVGSFGAFGLSMVNSFKRVVSPALVIAFAALEGVALGAFSKFIQAFFVPETSGLGDNIVMQAVIGTFAAFAGTLAAYKFLDIKVGQKFRTFVVAAMFGMVGPRPARGGAARCSATAPASSASAAPACCSPSAAWCSVCSC